MYRLILLMLVAFGVLNAKESPSFDCTKARTQTEKAICDSEWLSNKDREMAAVYKVKLNALDSYGKEVLKKSQLAFIKELNSCGSDNKCIEDKLKNRTNELLFFKDSNPNNPNPYFTIQNEIDLRVDGKCLGGKLCKASVIRFSNDKSFHSMRDIGRNSAILYFDDAGVVAFVGGDGAKFAKIPKSEVLKNACEYLSCVPYSYDELRIDYKDDDFIGIVVFGESCGTYCTEYESLAWVDIENMKVVDVNFPKLASKFINDTFCGGQKPSDEWSGTHKRCYKSLDLAHKYFYSNEFQKALDSKALWIDTIYFSSWWDSESKKFFKYVDLDKVIERSEEFDKFFVNEANKELCYDECYKDGSDYDDCSTQNVDCYKDEPERYFGGEYEAGIIGAPLSLRRDSMCFEIRHSYGLRSQDKDFCIDFDKLKPYAKGFLKKILESPSLQKRSE